MPPSAKRAKPATSTKTAKRAKKPATITRVPKWARALTDVVAAFEACDEHALKKALDAADPALLNHIPAVPEDMPLDDPRAVKWYRENCFFNACTEGALGKRPLSLVSSAAYMLAHTWSKRHALKRVTGYHRDVWISVFQTLIEHKKIDLNAHRAFVQYIPVLRRGPVDARPPSRWARRVSNVATAVSFGGFPGHLAQSDGERAFDDDGMRAWDYACRIRDVERHTENGGYARNVVSVMAQSRKLAPNTDDLADLFMLALPARPPVVPGYLFMDNRDFVCLLNQAEIPALRGLFRIVNTDAYLMDDVPYRRQAVLHMRVNMATRWRTLQRERLLGCVRWIARAHILLARWAAAAREASYAPGGAGFERAQLSFVAASQAH